VWNLSRESLLFGDMDTLTRCSGRFAAGLLAVDALLHLYWLTGATWPAPDERELSLAVLGFPAPFTAPVLIPLILLLATAAAAIEWRLRRGKEGTLGRGAHLVTLAVAAAAAVQVPLRLAWAAGLGEPGGGALFDRLNLVLYLPACVLLALAAYRVRAFRK
jgi:hypothetical protein